MSAEANKELARRFFEEVWNQGREAAIDEFLAADTIGNDPDFGTGKEVFRAQWKKWRAAVPDLHFAIEDLVAEGHKVLTRWTLTGTHQGEFIGYPATGRRFSVTGMSLDVLANGQIKAGFDSWDALGLRRQLSAGLDPASNDD